MRAIRPLLLVITAAATLCASEAEDRKALLDHLQQSSSEFAAAIKGLTPEQWNYKSSPDTWSVAECAEHIALSENMLRDMVSGKIMKSTANPQRPAERKVSDAKVIAMITDRSFKAKAPESLRPSGQFTKPEIALSKFEENRSKTVDFVKSATNLRDYAAPHPALKEQDMDAYQWLLLLSGHTMRHTAQIKEVKASAGFPK